MQAHADTLLPARKLGALGAAPGPKAEFLALDRQVREEVAAMAAAEHLGGPLPTLCFRLVQPMTKRVI
eukprot:1156195-Pelagomonas_calceolata.AAC.1